MSFDLTNIDPVQAWQPYEPSKDRPWSRRLAAHLYRRAAFAGSGTDLDRALRDGPAATLDRLCNPPAPDAASADFERSMQALAERTVEHAIRPAARRAIRRCSSTSRFSRVGGVGSRLISRGVLAMKSEI